MSILVQSSFSTDVVGGLGVADTGQTWLYGNVTEQGRWNISGGQASTTAATTAWIPTSASDVKTQVSFPVASGFNCTLIFRVVDNGNYLAVMSSASTWRLFRFVGGSRTELMNTAVTPANGDIVAVKAEGSTITVTINGVDRGAVTETTYQTQKNHGIRVNGTDATIRFDDFLVEDVVASGITYTGSGSSSGIATVSATNMLRKQSSGTASGTSQDSATPVYRRSAVGTSSGVATASASIGIITQHASGTSSGVTAAAAAPIQRRQALGTSSGIASNTATPNFRRSVSVIANGSSWTYISAPSSGTSEIYYYRKKMISRFGLLK